MNMGQIDDKIIRIVSDPPTVDVKSKISDSDNSGSIRLNPPTGGMGAKGS